MRLSISFFILVVSALDFWEGRHGSNLYIAALVAGILLAGSVIVDRLIYGRRKLAVEDEPEHDDHLPSKLR
jgi:hypothetical protein